VPTRNADPHQKAHDICPSSSAIATTSMPML